jgi:hypothetical protein
MAEAESFRVSRPTVSPHPPQEYSISLQATEAGTTKQVCKEDLGQYDAKGVLRTSSLKQQRKDYAMMGNPALIV